MKKELQNKKTYVSPPNLTDRKLIVEPAPHVTGRVTKDLLMKYTFVALCILAATAVLAFGITALITETIAVVVAVISDYLLYLVRKKREPSNIYSAAVSGARMRFRGGGDKVWGLWVDELSINIGTTLDFLLHTHHLSLDIIYDAPKYYSEIGCYSKLIFWNGTI